MEINFKKISLTLLAFVFAFISIVDGTLLNNDVFAEGNDISNLVVTNLTVSPTEINDGASTTVRLDFRESEKHNIKGGETINVSWTIESEIQFNGFVKEIPLEIQNKRVGTATIRQDGATIVFDESINNLDNVEGYVSFEVQGRNFTNTSGKDTKTGYISSGGKTVDVNVTKQESGTTSVFYYKTGNMDTSDTAHINWWLSANMNKVYVGKEIRIEDEIQGGHELVKDSFNITVTDYNKSQTTFAGANALNEFAQRYNGANININQNKITVRIPQNHGNNNQFIFNYKTKIAEQSQKEFVNNSKVWYQELYKDEVLGLESNFSVRNINVSAGITGTVKGELKIFKKVKGTEVGIQGVKFILKKADNTLIKGDKSEFTLETDSKGIANIKELPVGTYKIKEVSAPDWIDFNPLEAQELEFEVKESDVEGTLFNVENKVRTTSISVEKKWVDDREQSIASPEEARVEIELMRNNKSFNPRKIATLSPENSKAVFDSLEEYDSTGKKYEYTVKEMGLNENNEIRVGEFWYKSSISGDAKTGYVITNAKKRIVESSMPKTTKLKIVKRWEGVTGENTPESVTVRLLKDGNATNETRLLNSHNNWTATFDNLEYNKSGNGGKKIEYTVEEDGAINGKVVIGGKIFEVRKEMSELTLDNSKIIRIINRLEKPMVNSDNKVPSTPPTSPTSTKPATPIEDGNFSKPSVTSSTSTEKTPSKELKTSNAVGIASQPETNKTLPKTGSEGNASFLAWIFSAVGSILMLAELKYKGKLD